MIGVVVQGEHSPYLDLLGVLSSSTPVFLVIVGCIIFFVAFFGCYAAIKEDHLHNSHLLWLAWRWRWSSSWSLTQELQLTDSNLRLNEHLLETNMEVGMQNYQAKGYEGVTHTWELIQTEFDCCGVGLIIKIQKLLNKYLCTRSSRELIVLPD